MPAHRYPADKRGRKDPLSEMLDFGTEAPPPPSPDLSERIRKVKEKIEEINQRIQRLTAQRD